MSLIIVRLMTKSIQGTLSVQSVLWVHPGVKNPESQFGSSQDSLLLKPVILFLHLTLSDKGMDNLLLFQHHVGSLDAEYSFPGDLSIPRVRVPPLPPLRSLGGYKITDVIATTTPSITQPTRISWEPASCSALWKWL